MLVKQSKVSRVMWPTFAMNKLFLALNDVTRTQTIFILFVLSGPWLTLVHSNVEVVFNLPTSFFFFKWQIDVFNSIQELQEIKVESLESSKEKSKKGKHSSVRKAKEYMRYAFVRNEGSSIDRVCRYIFPFCYAVFNAVYWAYYELSTFGKHPPSDM